jgi:hypothetical protein
MAVQGGEEQARTISRLGLPAAAVIARQGPWFAGGARGREAGEEMGEREVGKDGGEEKGVWMRGDRGGALMRGVGKVERSVTESEREMPIPQSLVGKRVMPVPSMLPRTMPPTATQKIV